MCFNDVVNFIAKIYYKNVFTKDIIIVNCENVIITNYEDAIIIKLFYNKNNKNNEDIIIFILYFYIKFITLFKYLTLYYVSNFNL